MAEFAGYSRSEPEIRIHLFTGARDDRLLAFCGKQIPRTDLIDAEGLGDDEPLEPTNRHVCPICLPRLREWAKTSGDD